LKGNVAMMKQDYDGAEKMMKKGLDLGMPMKEAEVPACCRWECYRCKKMI
jgi:hypothetical protein